jgi:hypothetical protein
LVSAADNRNAKGFAGRFLSWPAQHVPGDYREGRCRAGRGQNLAAGHSGYRHLLVIDGTRHYSISLALVAVSKWSQNNPESLQVFHPSIVNGF